VQVEEDFLENSNVFIEPVEILSDRHRRCNVTRRLIRARFRWLDFVLTLMDVSYHSCYSDKHV